MIAALVIFASLARRDIVVTALGCIAADAPPAILALMT